jgi:hypothetical protein
MLRIELTLRWNPESGDVIHESYFQRSNMDQKDDFMDNFWVRTSLTLTRRSRGY